MEDYNEKKDVFLTNTAYSRSGSKNYDKKRFTRPEGILFDNLEKRKLEKVLERFTSPKKILEVGCGTGRFIRFALKKGHHVYGVDPSKPMLEETKKKTQKYENVRLYLGEGADLPFEDEVFDFTYSIRTLNQVDSNAYAKSMIKEIYRVTKKNGLILLEFINKYSLSVFKRKGVYLSFPEIKKYLKQNNLTIEKSTKGGIFVLSHTFFQIIPNRFIRFFGKIDIFLSRLFPFFTTRSYLLLKKA